MWYVLTVMSLTFLLYYDHPGEYLFAAAVNCAVWFLPVWIIVRTVRAFRRKK